MKINIAFLQILPGKSLKENLIIGKKACVEAKETIIVTNNDVNSYTTKLSAIMMGCSETTFYVLTVYFGAVGIRKYRYAIFTGLFADFIGIVMSIAVARYFFA